MKFEINKEEDKITVTGDDGGQLLIEKKSMAECERAAFVLCVAVKDVPKPPHAHSQEAFCFDCNSAVWFSPNTSPHTPPKVCVACLLKFLKEAGGVKPQFGFAGIPKRPDEQSKPE